MLKSYDKRIVCPVCGYEYAHPVAVYALCNQTRYSITATGLETEMGDFGVSTRGVILVREYLCEMHHRWYEIEQFNKGETFIETRIAEPLIGPTATIWRD